MFPCQGKGSGFDSRLPLKLTVVYRNVQKMIKDDTSKTALVVIDVQNYFVNDKTQELPEKIANYIEGNNFDFVLFTQFVNRKDSNFIKLLHWKKCFSAPDIDIDHRLKKFITKENLFTKTSYSIFKSSTFLKFLKKHNIKSILICGIDTDSCVLASAFDAFDLGYNVKVLKDLSDSHSGKDFHEVSMKIISKSIQKT